MRSIERLLEKARQFHKDGKGQGLCMVSQGDGGQWEAATTIYSTRQKARPLTAGTKLYFGDVTR